MSVDVPGSKPVSWLHNALLSQSALPSAIPHLIHHSLLYNLSSLELQAQDTTADSKGATMQQAGALQRQDFHSEASPWGTNAHTLVSVTGAVLYAQGLWGLW